jgi:thiol:disulfide interchange protein DsbD
MQDGWHVNWLNPGDAGLAPIIEWELPEGFTAGPIQWPHPAKFVLPELAIFGYGGEVFLLSEITPPRSMSSTSRPVLKAHVEWLACAEACVPGAAEVQLSLASSDSAGAPDPAWAPSFAKARLALPDSASAWEFGASLVGDGIRIRLTPPERSDVALKDVEFFPAVPGVIENASPQTLERRSNVYHLEVERDKMAAEQPSRIRGVLVSSEGWGSGARKAVVIDVSVTQ